MYSFSDSGKSSRCCQYLHTHALKLDQFHSLGISSPCGFKSHQRNTFFYPHSSENTMTEESRFCLVALWKVSGAGMATRSRSVWEWLCVLKLRFYVVLTVFLQLVLTVCRSYLIPCSFKTNQTEDMCSFPNNWLTADTHCKQDKNPT